MSSEDERRSKQHSTLGDLSSTLREFAPYLTMGMQLAIAVVAFFFIGYWIDQRYNTTPYGSIVGVVVGSIGGFLKFFKSVAELTKSRDSHQRDQEPKD